MDYEKLTYIHLANLIEKGCYKDGKPFLKIDFFKFVTGYKHGEDLLEFTRKRMDKYFKYTNKVYGTICKFLIENDYESVHFVEREWVYENPMYIHKVEVTKEMIDTVFDYMEVNGYPNVNRVYSYIFYEYANKRMEISKEDLEPKQNIIDFTTLKE